MHQLYYLKLYYKIGGMHRANCQEEALEVWCEEGALRRLELVAFVNSDGLPV